MQRALILEYLFHRLEKNGSRSDGAAKLAGSLRENKSLKTLQ